MKSFRNPAAFPLAVAMCFILSACGSLFLAPKSTTEKLAAGYIAHTAVLKATTNALNAGDISSSDAEHVMVIAKESRTFLDAAQVALTAGDPKTAEGKLALATTILTELQEWLRARDQ